MELTKDEEKMVSGGYGEATRRAMEILVKMGEYSGAKRMVPVSWADLSTFSGIGGGHGDSPDNDLYKFMKEMDDLCDRENVRFRCPTVLADVGDPERNERLTKMGAQLISPAGASSPHDIFPLPLFGQYVTPGATNINTYCNSMIGARGNNEGPVGVRMAAITGKTPEYGYLLDENRYARTVVDVQVEPVNYIEWAVLGFYISKRLSTHYWDVPVLTGINPLGVTSDDIMSFCASMNNPGSLTHFLIEGLSPEGRTLEQALGTNKPLERFTVGSKEMKEIYDTYPPTGNAPEIVTIRFPLTVQRLYEVARLFEGKKVHKDVAFSVDLTVSAKLVAERFGFKKKLEESGVLVAETQGQVRWKGKIMDPWVDAKRLGIKTMVTDSLKDCNAIGQQEVDMVLLPTIEKLIEVAITGKLEGDMEKIILKGHKGIGGVAEGEALVSKNALSYIFDVGGIWETPMSAKVTNKIEMPDWYGKDLANKVLVFPTGRGGIFSTAMLMGLANKGLGPKAMINIKTHPVFAYASIVMNIPTVDDLDKNPLEIIETGDWVKVDAERGIVEVTKKS